MTSLSQRIASKARTFLHAPRGLTLVPSGPGAVISDLFLWRRDDGWQTVFELLDIIALIDPQLEARPRSVDLVIYSSSGQLIAQHRVDVNPGGRRSVSLSDLIPEEAGEVGTFACFHSGQVPELASPTTFLAERGYCGYARDSRAPRSYVHGNLDAIARGAEVTEQLGGPGLVRSKYRLQVVLEEDAMFELGFVNPTQRTQHLLLTESGESAASVYRFSLPPRGSRILRLSEVRNVTKEAVVTSRLPMARPVVFYRKGESFDVFHG